MKKKRFYKKKTHLTGKNQRILSERKKERKKDEGQIILKRQKNKQNVEKMKEKERKKERKKENLRLNENIYQSQENGRKL